MSYIPRLPVSNNPAHLLQLVDRRLLNPEPLLTAVRSSSGTTASYECPWCDGSHRHHVVPGKAFYAKLNHCPEFHRLFPDTGHGYCAWFYIAGEMTEATAWRRYWFRNFKAMLAEWEYRDYPVKKRAA